MSTITAILEANADGTLHLPLPEELRHGKVKVTAALEPAEPPRMKAKAGLWKEMPGRFWMSADFDEPLEGDLIKCNVGTRTKHMAMSIICDKEI